MNVTILLCLLPLLAFVIMQQQPPHGQKDIPKVDLQALLKAAKNKKNEDDEFKEYTKIEQYKNPRLWACDLLAQCRLLTERVYNHCLSSG